MARYPTIPKLSGEPPSVQVLHALLEELRKSFEAIGRSVSVDLQPPLSEQQLRERCTWFPEEIAQEVYSLYSWRGGQRLREYNEFSPFWFRDMIFITPETAENEYQSMMETYGANSPPDLVGVDLAKCFPFAAFNGGWYLFPCGGQARDLAHPRGIVCVFQDIGIYFHSMETMIRTCIEWVKHPGYAWKDPKWEKIESEIWNKYNPRVFGR